ncbi:MAG: phosphatidylglycerophosphatase A [Alphaproteobacteria bacterium]
MASRLILLLATGFGVGNVSKAPGTLGSLLAIPVFLALPALGRLSLASLAILVAAIAAAVAIADRADPLMGEHDSGRIVIDEVAGMLVALAGLPRSALAIALAFAVFRVFDVAKPWPAGTVDRTWKGGAGVVLDDVASGVYANLVVRAALAFVGG